MHEVCQVLSTSHVPQCPTSLLRKPRLGEIKWLSSMVFSSYRHNHPSHMPIKNVHRHRTTVTCDALAGTLMTMTSNSWCPLFTWAPWKQSWASFWIPLQLVHSSITAHLPLSITVYLNTCLTCRLLWGPMMGQKKYSLHHHSFTQQIFIEYLLCARQWGLNRELTRNSYTSG